MFGETSQYENPTVGLEFKDTTSDLQVPKELRKLHADAVRPIVDALSDLEQKGKSQIIIVKIAARSGSSTAGLQLAQELEDLGFNACRVDSRLPLKILGKDMVVDEVAEMNPDQQTVVIIEEANALPRVIKEDPMVAADFKSSYFQPISDYPPVKLVFLSHDGVSEDGLQRRDDALVNNFKQFFGSTVENISFEKIALETFDDNKMNELLEKTIELYSLSQDVKQKILQKKKDILENVSTPGQLNGFLMGYIDSIKEGKSPEEALENGRRFLISRRSEMITEPWEKTRDKALIELGKQVAHAGSIALDSLQESQTEIVIHYKSFHFFREKDGNISVRGKIVEEFLKQDRIN